MDEEPPSRAMYKAAFVGVCVLLVLVSLPSSLPALRSMAMMLFILLIPVVILMLLFGFFASKVPGGAMFASGVVGAAAAGARRATPTRRNQRRDLCIRLQQVSGGVVTIRFPRASPKVAVTPHTDLIARGRVRGAVFFAERMDVDSGFGPVRVYAGGRAWKYATMGTAILLLLSLVSLLSAMSSGQLGGTA